MGVSAMIKLWVKIHYAASREWLRDSTVGFNPQWLMIKATLKRVGDSQSHNLCHEILQIIKIESDTILKADLWMQLLHIYNSAPNKDNIVSSFPLSLHVSTATGPAITIWFTHLISKKIQFIIQCYIKGLNRFLLTCSM